MFLIGGFLLATGIELGLKTGFFLFVLLLALIIAQILERLEGQVRFPSLRACPLESYPYRRDGHL